MVLNIQTYGKMGLDDINIIITTIIVIGFRDAVAYYYSLLLLY